MGSESDYPSMTNDHHRRHCCFISLVMFISISAFLLLLLLSIPSPPSAPCIFAADAKCLFVRKHSYAVLHCQEEDGNAKWSSKGDDQLIKRRPSSNIVLKTSLRWWSSSSSSASSSVRRRIVRESGPGSSPPRCTSKCGNCKPCKAVHVSVPPGIPVTTEYYPQAWRCKCGNNLYMP